MTATPRKGYAVIIDWHNSEGWPSNGRPFFYNIALSSPSVKAKIWSEKEELATPDM